MPPSTCCFCAHLNPARAKFCNECASPLHLKPCRQCDAVNARDASTCYRCTAALAPAVSAQETTAERIVADADATLAALKRELVAPAISRADIVVTASDVDAAMHERGEGGDTVEEDETPSEVFPDDATPRVSVQPAPPSSPWSAQEGGREASLQPGPPADDPPEGMGDVRQPQAEAPSLRAPGSAASIAVDPDERRWRPERRSRVPALLALLALVVVPAALYWFYNPAKVDAWLGRTAVPLSVETPLADPAPAIPAVAIPAAAPASPAMTGESAPPAAPADAPVVGTPVTQEGAAVSATPPLSSSDAAATSPEAASVAPVAPATAAAAPARAAKATPSTRARSSTAGGRARERTTKPRPKAPAAQAQRRPDPPAATEQASPAEPCPASVAALGLCNP